MLIYYIILYIDKHVIILYYTILYILYIDMYVIILYYNIHRHACYYTILYYT